MKIKFILLILGFTLIFSGNIYAQANLQNTGSSVQNSSSLQQNNSDLQNNQNVSNNLENNQKSLGVKSSPNQLEDSVKINGSSSKTEVLGVSDNQSTSSIWLIILALLVSVLLILFVAYKKLSTAEIDPANQYKTVSAGPQKTQSNLEITENNTKTAKKPTKNSNKKKKAHR